MASSSSTTPDAASVTATTPNAPILSVSELNRQARVTIEAHFKTIWVTGELSNFARPRSGHWYFSLKDQQAQVRCAMFVNRNRAVQMQPTDGQQVLLRGRVSLYEGRGDFQIIVDYMEPAGEGLLRQAFDQLKLKLAGEGLFDPGRKRPLPGFPRRCAVITSPSGAALRDVLAVWQRRYPALEVILVPAMVQGDGAEAQLLTGLARAQQLSPDVILLTRGGGSLEDLWSFNSEALARAVAASPIPVVSAVGHEIDTTISDLVADVRAPTPSAAAELMTPDGQELIETYRAFEVHLSGVIRGYLQHLKLVSRNAFLRLPNPAQIIEQLAQRIDDNHERLRKSQANRLRMEQARLAALVRQLPMVGPQAQLKRLQARLEHLKHLHQRAMQATLASKGERHGQLARMLHGLSPLPTLSRGYAVLRDDAANVVSSIAGVEAGQKIDAILKDGTVHARIESVSDKGLDDSTESMGE
ncbi:MAG: exodeoxyribonuclease VII large subunit [Pseudomonadales bacterium]